VQKLPSGDINIGSAMGDSVSAARGAATVNLLQALIEKKN
jgi:hypothetical protein